MSREFVALIVDDDPDILAAYQRLLERRIPQLKVVVADSSPEALKMLARSRIDLVVSDYRMPEMDGIEFLIEARRINPRIRKIMFTAYAEPELARRAAAEAMVDAFISKDVEPEELVERIERLLPRSVRAQR